jgi:ribosomal-protein-alanine N-acetyltransferase
MLLPRELTTERLVLRAPREDDASAIFARYASDPEVTRLLGWPRHRALDDTRVFLAFAERHWQDGTDYPYLIMSRADGRLLGGTGLTPDEPHVAMTGYVLAKDAWGRGYATEATRAMVDIAFALPELWRLYAYCHVSHAASERVLLKAGLTREATLRRHTVFPNLGTSEPQDVAMWARVRV